MPRRNSNAAPRDTPMETTDRNYGYRQPAASIGCDKCPAVFAADDQDTVDAALQDHLDNAHGKRRAKAAAK